MYSYDVFMLMYETITICKVIILQLKKKKNTFDEGLLPKYTKKKKKQQTNKQTKNPKHLLKLNNKTSNPIKRNRPRTLTNISSKKTNTLQ